MSAPPASPKVSTRFNDGMELKNRLALASREVFCQITDSLSARGTNYVSMYAGDLNKKKNAQGIGQI